MLRLRRLSCPPRILSPSVLVLQSTDNEENVQEVAVIDPTRPERDQRELLTWMSLHSSPRWTTTLTSKPTSTLGQWMVSLYQTSPSEAKEDSGLTTSTRKRQRPQQDTSISRVSSSSPPEQSSPGGRSISQQCMCSMCQSAPSGSAAPATARSETNLASLEPMPLTRTEPSRLRRANAADALTWSRLLLG